MICSRKLHTPTVYKIKVLGQLDKTWEIWFDGFDIVPCEEGATMIIGIVPDQACLHGLLAKIRDLGLVLLMVSCLENS